MGTWLKTSELVDQEAVLVHYRILAHPLLLRVFEVKAIKGLGGYVAEVVEGTVDGSATKDPFFTMTMRADKLWEAQQEAITMAKTVFERCIKILEE